MRLSTPAHRLDAATESALKSALRDLPATSGSAALERRVLDGWRAQHASASPWGPVWIRMEARTRLAGAALAICALVGGGWWLHRPDPVMQELMQVDVLSQLTAGQL